MRKTGRAALFVVLTSFGLSPVQANADWCSANAGIPVEEAYEKASLIFYGKLMDMWPTAMPERTVMDLGNGNVGASIDCIPSEAKPYDPRKDCGISYRAQFKVLQVIKDVKKVVKKDTVQVNAVNSGFQFARGEEGYLVYAWDWPYDKDELPWASLCARTRPQIYAADDIRYFEKLGVKLHLHFRDMLGKLNQE